SFDPVTNGHLDIFRRASRIYDEVVVVVSVNPSKRTMFTVEERMDLIKRATVGAGLTNVVADSFQGLIVDYCRAHDLNVVVKGIRATNDYDYEAQMAHMNYHMAQVETLFMPTGPRFSFLSSSLIKEIATLGADVSELVPPEVLPELLGRIEHR